MKKKFVRVMLFGALTLAVSTAVTSCKDYDDDVKNLQEQIDKITSNNPVSKEDMQSAISSAISSLQSQLETAIAGKADNQAVVALQAKVTELTEALKGKVDASKVEDLMKQIDALSKEVNSVKGSLDETKANLEAEISKLKEQLANAANKEEVDALTEQLAGLQTKLATVEQATKDNAGAIAALTTQIAQLEGIQEAIAELQKADEEFAKTSDLEAYSTTEEMKALLASELTSYMTETEIATYVSNAIQTLKETELKTISDKLDTYNTELANHITAWNKFVGSSTLTLKDVESKLTTLGQFDSAIELALKNGQYADFAALVTEVNTLKTNYANCVTINNVNEKVNAALTAALANNDSEFAKLTARVAKLEQEMGAMKNMIQSITYIPTRADRKVEFTTLHAKKDKNDTDFKITLTGASRQKVKFRIAPATAAAEFAANYDVVFSADAETRAAAAPTEMFKIVEAPVVEDGFVTYTIQPNTDQSYSVCMHVTTKADKVETLGKTDITSDYFAAMLEDKYLVDAYYKATSVDKTIFYDKEEAEEGKADYNIGEVVLSVADSKTGTPSDETLGELTKYPGFDVSKLATTFEVTNPTYFKIANGVVTLTKYNTPSYTTQTGEVTATVAATGFYTKEEAKTLGTVSVKKTAKTAEINYGEIKATWNNADNTIAATSFPLATIYDDPQVQLTASEFAALTGTPTQTDAKGNKAWFNVATSGNVLTATVKAQAPEGKYPIEVVFESTDKARVITVKATIVVGYPDIKKLAVNGTFWDEENNKVGFTPTLDDDLKPTKITTEYTLSDLFTNYSEVEKVVAKISGAKLEITVPDWNNINGLLYDKNSTVLTFKDGYDGFMNDNKTKAEVKVVAKVSLNGVTEPLQEYSAVVSIMNISGSWVAGNLTASLDDKAATYKLAEGFIWNDMRGKAMWKNGAQIDDEKEFGSKTPLSIYKLSAPTFKFVDAQGKDTTCEYLAVDANTGELTFTTTGKGYAFIKPYTARVMVVAESQWGEITGYNGNNIITVTIPASK